MRQNQLLVCPSLCVCGAIHGVDYANMNVLWDSPDNVVIWYSLKLGNEALAFALEACCFWLSAAVTVALSNLFFLENVVLKRVG